MIVQLDQFLQDTAVLKNKLTEIAGGLHLEDLDRELNAAKKRNALSLIEVSCSIGARPDLGRPTTTALENKQNFMNYLKTL